MPERDRGLETRPDKNGVFRLEVDLILVDLVAVIIFLISSHLSHSKGLHNVLYLNIELHGYGIGSSFGIRSEVFHGDRGCVLE